jgi:hypothetical protein
MKYIGKTLFLPSFPPAWCPHFSIEGLFDETLSLGTIAPVSKV